jgi:hypothetical protein
MSNPLIAPKQFPTKLDNPELLDIANRCAGIHESLLRSCHVLMLVKDLLQKKVDHEVILQIIQLNYDEQS